MSSWLQIEGEVLILLNFMCEPNMNPQSKIVTLTTQAGFQANQGKCLGRVVVVFSVAYPLNHAAFLSKRCLLSQNGSDFSVHIPRCGSQSVLQGDTRDGNNFGSPERE